MRCPMSKHRLPAAIGLLLGVLLFLVAATGGSAHPDPQLNRTPQSVLTMGGNSLLAPTAVTPTSTSAPSATPAGATTPLAAKAVPYATNSILPWVLLASLALIALVGLLYNRSIRRPPPHTE